MLQVMVCHEKSTGDVFAMKIMKKAHILQQPDVSAVVCSKLSVHVTAYIQSCPSLPSKPTGMGCLQ